MEKLEIYRDLASRNGWDFSMVDDRPYFMKNGDYASPNEDTSLEDKRLLANIISEGSSELEKLILLSWNNGLTVTGPCSGIREYHDKPPIALHFGVKGPMEIVFPLYQSLLKDLPDYSHLCRDQDDITRYDFNYFLNGKTLSKEESEKIFKKINEEINEVLGKEKTKKL